MPSNKSGSRLATATPDIAWCACSKLHRHRWENLVRQSKFETRWLFVRALARLWQQDNSPNSGMNDTESKDSSEDRMNRIAGTRCLVTGGAGFIGSTIVDQLLDAGAAEVVVVDNF